MRNTSLKTDRKYNNLRDKAVPSRTQNLSTYPWLLLSIKASIVNCALVIPAHICYKQTASRQMKWSNVGVHARSQVNVKHGDYLRTLGGAMIAQCKSIASAVQPEWLSKDLSVISFDVCMCVFSLVCYQRGIGGGHLKQEISRRLCPLVMSISWSEEYVPGMTPWSSPTLCVFDFPGVAVKKTISMRLWPIIVFFVFFLCLPCQISGDQSPAWTLTFWISRHVHSAARTVSIWVRNTQQWPWFCIDKTLIWCETSN